MFKTVVNKLNHCFFKKWYLYSVYSLVMGMLAVGPGASQGLFSQEIRHLDKRWKVFVTLRHLERNLETSS